MGFAAAVSFIADATWDVVAAGLLTTGLAAGAIVADRAFVSPYDYTMSESRLLQLGTLAGGVAALAVPVAVRADSPQPYFAAANIGGLLGLIITHHMLEPAHARGTAPLRSGLRTHAPSIDVSFTAQMRLMASTAARGNYPVLNVGF